MLKPEQVEDLLRLGLFETLWIQQMRFVVKPEYAHIKTGLDEWVLAIGGYW